MKLKYLVFSLLLAGSMVLNGIGFAHADELKVSGFADIIYTFVDETGDDAATPALKNAKEQKFAVGAEVDFEKTQGPVTFRLDLDFPEGANNVALQGAGNTADEIEQAKFVWALPVLQDFNLSLTGGIYNSPIGFEAQDAPDLLQTTNGQLFNLVPSNLAGLMLSGGTGPLGPLGPVGINVLFGNEWRADTNEENTWGVTVSVAPMGDLAALDLAFLTSDDGAPTVSDEDLFHLLLSGKTGVAPDVELTYAVEYLTDENNDALGLTGSLRHNTPNYPHGITVRWDEVDCDGPTNPAGAGRYCADLGALTELNVAGGTDVDAGESATPNTFTVAGFVDVAESLTTVLEFKSVDSDLPAGAAGTGSNTIFTLEFIATF